MKIQNIAVMALAWMSITFTSCEYDNYEAPSYEFKGQLYVDVNGEKEPFLFDAGKDLFKLCQSGFGKDDGGIAMKVNNDGSFKQLLFDNSYKLTLYDRKYPFEMPDFPQLNRGFDSIPYTMSRNIVQDFEIRPYYRLSNLKAELSADKENVVATFDVTKMTNTQETAPKIVKARIYLSTTVIVDSGTSCQKDVVINSDAEHATLSVLIPLSMYRDKKYYVNNFRTSAYYRVSIELNGKNEYFLFSDIKKIEGLPVKK